MATHTTSIGDVAMTIVEEEVLPTSARWMFPDAEAPFEILEGARDWLTPHFANERGHLLQSIQTFVIRADGLTLVVDTGVGNDKERPGGNIQGWNMRSGPFLEDLSAVVDPAEVNFVISTHMHVDHVGWNTRLIEGAWIPTFPNARYLFVDREWAHWSADAETNEGSRRLVDDSLRPVLEAGRVDLVPPDHRISDSLWLEPSHGHSPGHVNVRVASAGVEAALIGDMMHSPLQCHAPTERPTFDRDAQWARETRVAFLERVADSEVLVYGSHWHIPVGGRVRRAGTSFRLEAREE